MSAEPHRDGLALLAASSLSSGNPLATKEQRDVEALAIRLYQTPQVQKARHEVARMWLDKPRLVSPEALATFEGGVADYVFCAVLNAANSDANYPKVVLAQCEPHSWFGMNVPGSRRGGNNADNAYRHVKVDGVGRYEITVRQVKGHVPADVTYTLIGNTSMSKTLGCIEMRDLDIGPDGVFSLTIDPSPANGRKNHLQSTPEAKYVFVRDSMTDWTTQIPNAMTIRRLDPDGAPPLSFDKLVETAVEYIHADAQYYSQVIDITLPFPDNDMAKPFNAGKFGGLVTQAGSVGYYTVGDDQALVVTFTMAGANYMAFHAHDPWWRTIPFACHTSTLNNSQTVANPDGSITLVLSVRDPGVHNWIDTAGLHEGIISFRWQGLPHGQKEEDGPQILGVNLVDLRELPRALPAGTRFVSTGERLNQIAARTKAVAARWVDC